MAMPHADDSSSCSAWRPSHDREPGIQPSDGYESRLAVIVPLVRAGEMRPGKDLTGATHVQAAILQRSQPLLSVAGDPYGVIVATKNAPVKPPHKRVAAG